MKSRRERVTPGPDEDLSWNKLFSKAITDPETFKHYEGETLHYAIVEFFKSIPEMTASPLFCHETLKLFNQHKKAIMNQCDPPVTWSDIIEDDNTRAMYMATFLGDGVAAAAAEEVEDEDEDMEQQEGGNMAGFNEHVEEEAQKQQSKEQEHMKSNPPFEFRHFTYSFE